LCERETLVFWATLPVKEQCKKCTTGASVLLLFHLYLLFYASSHKLEPRTTEGKGIARVKNDT